jgi:hypothetical protein
LSPRPRATFTKRQKEQNRQEKQRAKAQRKLQRKLESQAGVQPQDTEEILANEEAVSESSLHVEQLSSQTVEVNATGASTTCEAANTHQKAVVSCRLLVSATA